MVNSFLGWDKIPEYFNDTVGYFDDELVYFLDFDRDADDDGPGLSMAYVPFVEGAQRQHTFVPGDTYDDLRERIRPWFPESGWFVCEGQMNLIVCTHGRGYKRSFSISSHGGVYTPVTGFGNSTRKVKPIDKFPTIEEAFAESSYHNSVPISNQFSLMGGNNKYRDLRYLQTPVGIVTHTGAVHLHPVYAPLLKREVQNIL